MTVPPARPLSVIALGGNALSPPAGDMSLAGERSAIERAVADLLPLIDDGARLLIVHGNGPQVGRLLAGGTPPDDLDITVAQTQGELGYLLAAAIEARRPNETCAALITRSRVDPNDPAFARPTKPVGAVLPKEPPGQWAARTPDGKGWRRVVASPRPSAVLECAAIARLLATHHVIAGGGGGVPVGPEGPEAAVIDKDWTAALLAVDLGAERLIYVTDVAAACDGFAKAGETPIAAMTVAEAKARLAQNVFAEGSMRPKIESAVSFVEASSRPAHITAIGRLEAALAGQGGTAIRP